MPSEEKTTKIDGSTYVGENGQAAQKTATSSPTKSPAKVSKGKMVGVRIRLLDGTDWDTTIEVI